jgi:Cu/Ag efflux pump CusA
MAATVDFPTGTYLAMSGVAHARAQAQRDLLLHAAFGSLGVVLLLSIVAGHWRNFAVLLLNLPLALAGGVAAVAITSSSLSLGSLVGFITLFGISARNAIMMLSHYQHLVHVEGLRWMPDTVLRGATDRVVPILMTALVTGLGLLPVALASTKPGGEIDGPMATVILGGLLTSTALNLLVFPTLVMRYGRIEGNRPEAA